MLTKDAKFLNNDFFKYTVPRISEKEEFFLSGKILTEFPLLEPSRKKHPFEYGDYFYIFSVDDYGGRYSFWYKKKITPKNQRFIDLIRKELEHYDE